jgi:hypothetical protein
LVLALALLALVVAARGLERRTTWYLASDQFAFLTFADDLRQGTVFHDPTIVRRLSPGVPPDVAVDALFQTYIYRDHRLYSRYPPGFPMLLAAAGALGGEPAQHLLNPVLYLLLLAALGVGVGRLAGAGAGVAVMWAMLVVPAEVHYWGITVARDLPAHLLALLSVWLAWRARTTTAAFVLGMAATIRPDAVLWGLAVGAVAVRQVSLATVLRGAIAFLVGLSPLLAYNTITQGHPLAFTQGSEFRNVLAAAPPPMVVSLVSGGGFKLSNLRETLPVHVHYLWNAFGLLLVPALGALALATWRRTAVAGAFGPYAVVAFVFYSCWGHGDGRYLVGVVLCLLALMAIGVADGCRWIAANRRRGIAAVAGVALVVVVMRRDGAERVRPLELAVAGGAVASLALPPAFAALAPAIGFAGIGMARVVAGSGARDPFQEPQVARARSAIEALVPSGSLVLTTPALGRPGENISHYTHADAAYLGETTAMRSSPARAGRTVLGTGDNVFLLLAPTDPLPFAGDIHVVARRDGATLYDWFGDPSRSPLGAVLYEVKSVAPDA